MLSAKIRKSAEGLKSSKDKKAEIAVVRLSEFVSNYSAFINQAKVVVDTAVAVASDHTTRRMIVTLIGNTLADLGSRLNELGSIVEHYEQTPELQAPKMPEEKINKASSIFRIFSRRK